MMIMVLLKSNRNLHVLNKPMSKFINIDGLSKQV